VKVLNVGVGGGGSHNGSSISESRRVAWVEDPGTCKSKGRRANQGANTYMGDALMDVPCF
jgi:hypothetical protein